MHKYSLQFEFKALSFKICRYGLMEDEEELSVAIDKSMNSYSLTRPL